MKRSFVDLIARYPDPPFKNLYASYACFARDKTAFEDAMRGLPSNLLMPNFWLSGHSHEACLRWRESSVRVMDSNLTPDDFDWLRKLKGAADAKRDPPQFRLISEPSSVHSSRKAE